VTTIQGLTPRNESAGKTYYEPTIRQCKGGSKFNAKKSPDQHQFLFSNLDGFWNLGNHSAPVVGEWYALELSSKPAENGMWRDIVKMEHVDGPPASDGMIPRNSPTVYDNDPFNEFPQGTPDQAERSMNEDFAPTQSQPGLRADDPETIQRNDDPFYTGKPDHPFIENHQRGAEKPNTPPVEQDKYQLSAARRDAMILIEMGVWEIPAGRNPLSWVKECSARMFYFHHATVMEPQYWCYEHHCARNKGSNGYGHPVEDGSCVWEKGIIVDEGE